MTPKRILALSALALLAAIAAGWTWDDRILALISF